MNGTITIEDKDIPFGYQPPVPQPPNPIIQWLQENYEIRRIDFILIISFAILAVILFTLQRIEWARLATQYYNLSSSCPPWLR